MAEGPALVLAGYDDEPLTSLAAYREVGGYEQLAKARAQDPQAVIQEIIESNLRGRGGAFFPTGRKASFIPTPDKIAKPIYITVNADESEPGTFKDREIMLKVPHRLIEGCLVAAYAIQSKHVYIYIRGEYSREYEVLQAALDEAREANLLGGVEIVDSPRRRRVHLRRGDGPARVAGGEARAAALEAAVPGDPGAVRRADADQQRRVDHDDPGRSSPSAPRSTRRSAPRRTRPAHGSSASPGTSSGRASTRLRTGSPCAT